MFDIAAGTLLETVDAHSGPVWSISLSPDKVKLHDYLWENTLHRVPTQTYRSITKCHIENNGLFLFCLVFY